MDTINRTSARWFGWVWNCVGQFISQIKMISLNYSELVAEMGNYRLPLCSYKYSFPIMDVLCTTSSSFVLLFVLQSQSWKENRTKYKICKAWRSNWILPPMLISLCLELGKVRALIVMDIYLQDDWHMGRDNQLLMIISA